MGLLELRRGVFNVMRWDDGDGIMSSNLEGSSSCSKTV